MAGYVCRRRCAGSRPLPKRGEDSIREQSDFDQDSVRAGMIFHISCWAERTRAPAMRKADWKWRVEIMLAALVLGILVGAIAAGRLKFPFPW